MKSSALILGTAGHIDHGKSSLIKALTGTDPDRLAEEKSRGITIELGFAQLTLPNGRTMGVIDVPGHEKFVRQMVAGASGVDIALLVIAADDGIMPQTAEHLAVLELLAVSSCVVALTKADLVDKEWLEFVTGEIEEYLASTPFGGAPIVAVSSKTGTGLDELLVVLEQTAVKTEVPISEDIARLPVDRVFTIKGAGTVVTGTLWSGSIAPDDVLELLPSGREARVRELQVHNEIAGSALAGMRVAVNIGNLKTEDIPLGSFLVSPRALVTTDRLNVKFTYLGAPSSKKPLKSGTRVHVAHGTTEVLGRILLMNSDKELVAGDSCFAQIRLEEKLAPRYGDRFIVRSYSPVAVIGGGTVLDCHPKHRANLSADEIDFLAALDEHDEERAVMFMLKSDNRPLSAKDLSERTGLSPARIESVLANASLEKLSSDKTIFYCDKNSADAWVDRIENTLLTFHMKNPTKTGTSARALQHLCGKTIDDSAFDALLARAVEKGLIGIEKGEVSHNKAGSSAKRIEEKSCEEILVLLKKNEKLPPVITEMQTTLGLDKQAFHKALNRLEDEGRIVRIDTTICYLPSTIEDFEKSISLCLSQMGEANAATLRDEMGVSRKYAIPLLEFFDAKHFTERDGDMRHLKSK